ncbi:hypothetical protein HDV05_005818 [Chytridiales sp. JEL 0842]|nr:hypothetical protein HDV05_005818 [Chytridiales sp. JEL 0842]
MWRQVTTLLSSALSPLSTSSAHPEIELLHDNSTEEEEPLSPEDDFFKGKAKYEEKQYKEAVNCLTRPAVLGHADSMKYLSLCYAAEALNEPVLCKEWMEKREEVLKHPEGMFAHAQALRSGGEDLEAVSWFRLAAEQDHPDSAYQLGVYMRKLGNAEAMKWFERAAEAPNGHYMAEMALAEGYERGICVEANPELAAKYREKLFQRELEAQQKRAEVEAALDAEARESEKSRLKALEREADMKLYQEAIRLHEWGYWVKGIQILAKLKESEFTEAVEYMDPLTSKLKNPTGMFWMSAHFEDLGGDDNNIIAMAWYGKAVAKGGTVPRELRQTLGHSTMPEMRAKRIADDTYKEAMNQIEWGYWVKGLELLEKLAKEGHPASKTYLDPDTSPMKNPTGMEHLADLFESRMKDLALIYSEMGPTEDQREQIAKLESLVSAWRTKAYQLKGGIAPTPLSSTRRVSITTLASTSTANKKPTLPSVLQLSGNYDSDFKSAKSNIEWGSYAKGVQTIGYLASQGHQPSIDFLDPVKSNVKDPACFHWIGLHHLNELKNESSAALWFKKGADAGNHKSMTEFGKLILEGKGIISKNGKVGGPDPWQAVGWFTKAWDVGGNADAAFELGKAYAYGLYVHEETVDGKRASGMKPSDSKLDVSGDASLISLDSEGVAPPTVEDNLKELENLAVADPTPEVAAQTVPDKSKELPPTPEPEIPEKVVKTKTIVKQDDTKAVEWFKRGSNKDHPGCLNMLGECLREGRGVAENTKQAAAYFKKAAEKGLAVAMYNYGSCLLHGVGVEVDETKALLWLTRASKATETTPDSSLP